MLLLFPLSFLFPIIPIQFPIPSFLFPYRARFSRQRNPENPDGLHSGAIKCTVLSQCLYGAFNPSCSLLVAPSFFVTSRINFCSSANSDLPAWAVSTSIFVVATMYRVLTQILETVNPRCVLSRASFQRLGSALCCLRLRACDILIGKVAGSNPRPLIGCNCA